MKKTAVLLLLIGLASAVTASGQNSAQTPTSAPTGGMEPGPTPTAAPTRGIRSTVTPTAAPMGRRRPPMTPASAPMSGMNSQMTPTTSPAPGQANAPAARPQDNYVSLNFTNVDISALVKLMSELTHRNFILDERITGKVTIMTPTRISPDEAYQVFLSALEIKGFTVVEDGKVNRLIPIASARQSGLKVFQDGDGRGHGFVTKLLRMNFVNPQEIVRTVTPLMTKDGSMIAYTPTNSVIMTDSVSNIRKIEALIHAMDVAAPEGKGKINVYYLKHANAEDIAKMMQALVSRLPGAQAGGAVQPAGPSAILEGAVNITADKSTNSLVIVGSPGDFATMKDVIQKLDIRRRQVYVEAAIIEMTLSKSLDIGLELQYVDKSNIDSENKNPSYGAVAGTNFGNIGKATTGGPAALGAINGLVVAAVKGAFKYNGATFLNIGALLHALQANGDVNVLSTPNLLTTDNQKAEIMVGSNIPFVTGQSQNAATGGTAILTTVDRKDVGITLKLTPQITSDDSVRLDIYQEISDIITTAGLDPNVVGPSTSKRSASTTVVVKDRQTMVIGGLIRDNVISSSSSVPFLGNIPILGWLFKTKLSSVDKTNLMIFITPYIIKNEFDSADMTNRKTDVQEKFRQEYRIEKKDFGSDLPKHAPAAPPSGSTGPAEGEEMPEELGETIQSAPSTTTEKTGVDMMRSSPTSTPPTSGPGTQMTPFSATTAPVKKDTGVMMQTAPTTTNELKSSPMGTPETKGTGNTITTFPTGTPAKKDTAPLLQSVPTTTTGIQESVPVPKSSATYTPLTAPRESAP